MSHVHVWRLDLLLLGFVSASAAHASPTAADFAECPAVAAWSLRHCLGVGNPVQPDAACWQKSQQDHQHCVESVMDRYAEPTAAQRDAQRKAGDAAEAAAAARREAKSPAAQPAP